jgi:hypothetical protein
MAGTTGERDYLKIARLIESDAPVFPVLPIGAEKKRAGKRPADP